MKLKEYIDILSKFDPNVEVLKKQRVRNCTQLAKLNKAEILEPHLHFCYNPKTGKETLMDSFVV